MGKKKIIIKYWLHIFIYVLDRCKHLLKVQTASFRRVLWDGFICVFLLLLFFLTALITCVYHCILSGRAVDVQVFVTSAIFIRFFLTLDWCSCACRWSHFSLKRFYTLALVGCLEFFFPQSLMILLEMQLCSEKCSWLFAIDVKKLKETVHFLTRVSYIL